MLIPTPKIQKLYGIEIITTQKVIHKLDRFQYRIRKIDKLGWWYLEIISSYEGTQFISMEFQDKCQTRCVHLKLAALEHQKMNRNFELTWRTLLSIAN